MKLKDILKDEVGEENIEKIKSSFDVVGDIAIIEVPEELDDKKAVIAKALLKSNSHIKTVCRKLGEREGKYRLRDMEVLLGEKTETIHTEFGCRFFLDVKTDYFSPRESTERKRIADCVKKGEKVFVMFSGIGPYMIVIAKHSQAGEVWGVEINPHAHEHAIRNVKMNKLTGRVFPLLGDVKVTLTKREGHFDRVMMPLPKEGYKYLDVALKSLKKKGVIHFYFVEGEKDLFKESVKLLRESVKNMGFNIKVIGKRKVLPYGPRTWKVCIDAEIRK